VKRDGNDETELLKNGLDTISLKKWNVIQKKTISHPNVEVCQKE
jgi:hypothetical protein